MGDIRRVELGRLLAASAVAAVPIDAAARTDGHGFGVVATWGPDPRAGVVSTKIGRLINDL